MSDLDLVKDLVKKSGLLWIRHAGRDFPVWHELVDGADGWAICVVGEGAEQPLPDVRDGDTVTLLLRAKSNRQLVASVDATVEVLSPDDPAWETATAALKSGRLNLPDLPTAVERWARESRVLRFMPFEPVTMATDLPDSRPLSAPRLWG